jgi:glutamyl-tRNA synthetase/glutamyl-Q tRNA(Asp) synthetase
MPVVSRFAPAPTGHLHLGHVVDAIHVWDLTRARGGRVLLRIEDHDRQRSRTEFERSILEDLEWLGFEADAPPVRQSERHPLYEEMLDRLRAQGLVYACDCSRASLTGSRYSGACRGRRLEDRPGRTLRVRLDPAVERFEDLRHGPQEQQPWQQCGDVPVRDREGNWTYQFACAVDDYAQGVTLVVRGDDLLDSTGRQLQLARLLGREDQPLFFHHSLVMKSPTEKLSKSDGDTGVRELRARGWSAGDVLRYAREIGMPA